MVSVSLQNAGALILAFAILSCLADTSAARSPDVQLMSPATSTVTVGGDTLVYGGFRHKSFDEVWIQVRPLGDPHLSSVHESLPIKAATNADAFLAKGVSLFAGKNLLQVICLKIDDRKRTIRVAQDCLVVERSDPPMLRNDGSGLPGSPSISSLNLSDRDVVRGPVVRVVGHVDAAKKLQFVLVNDVVATMDGDQFMASVFLPAGLNQVEVLAVDEAGTYTELRRQVEVVVDEEIIRLNERWETDVPTTSVIDDPNVRGYCEVGILLENGFRHVWNVNAECPPSWHSLPFGNWGVDSNFGSRVDGCQFPGWRHCDGPSCKLQWNSCTKDHRPSDSRACNYYNFPEMSSGAAKNCDVTSTFATPNRCNTQYSEHPATYGRTRLVLPTDVRNGCAIFSGYRIVIRESYMKLYELDWDGDERIGRLNYPSFDVRLSTCQFDGCQVPTYSRWVSPDPANPDWDGGTAQVRAVVSGTGYFEVPIQP